MCFQTLHKKVKYQKENKLAPSLPKPYNKEEINCLKDFDITRSILYKRRMNKKLIL